LLLPQAHTCRRLCIKRICWPRNFKGYT